MMHVIRKQVIDLQVHKKLNAFRMQHLVSDRYRKQLVPLLEAVFDAYAGEEEIIRLDTLEIDLGVLSEKELEKTGWDEAFLAKVKERILQSLPAASAKAATVRQTKSAGICGQWFFYMQHGYLHWNTVEINREWYGAVLETLAAGYGQVTELRGIIKKNKQALARITARHPDAFLAKLAEVLTAQNQKDLAAAVNEIHEVLALLTTYHDPYPAPGLPAGQQAPAPAPGHTVGVLWQQAIYIAASAAPGLTTEKIAGAILRNYITAFETARAIPEKLLAVTDIITNLLRQVLEEAAPVSGRRTQKAGNPAETGTGKEIKEAAEDDRQRKAAPVKSETELSDDTAKIKMAEGVSDEAFKSKAEQGAEAVPVLLAAAEAAELKAIQERAQAPSTDLLQANFSKEIPADGIFTACAGLVVVHPFLNSLFRRLNLLHEKNFIHAEAQQKAVYLLYYLATGKTAAEEYELVVPKLLSGHSLTVPVPEEVPLSAPELAEAEDMLAACIQQWDKIKGTSPGGLREGFLQRKGRLFIKNDSPYLQIETSGIDILLDYLPWNIGIIKLPWLKEIIRVEWR